MIYKYTKCESVIAKILADLDANEKGNRITDIKEWIFEAVDKIGAPMQYIQKETNPIKIEDYQIPIPDDLQHLHGVAFSTNPDGPWFPARTEGSSFKDPKRFENKQFNGSSQPMQYKLPTAQTQLYLQNSHKSIDNYLNGRYNKEATYFIKPGWIVFNKKEGYIKLSYSAVATDERGYPLIPDTTSYQEAIYWYVVMKLKFPKFLNGSLGGRARYNQGIYTYLQQQWNFYRNQAYAEAMMPTEGDLISIKNEWTKLIPDWEADDRFFETVGKRQVNYNDYYYGY